VEVLKICLKQALKYANPVGSKQLLYNTGPVKWTSSADVSNGSDIVKLFGFMEHVVSINNKVKPKPVTAIQHPHTIFCNDTKKLREISALSSRKD